MSNKKLVKVENGHDFNNWIWISDELSWNS